MAKTCLTVQIHTHGPVWWLCIGWWYRPIQYMFWGAASALCGFRKIRIVKKGET